MQYACTHSSGRQEEHPPLYDEVDDGSCAGEGPVRGEKDGDVGGVQLARVGAERRHQPLEGAGLDETHPHRLPLQVRDLIVRVLPQAWWGVRTWCTRARRLQVR